MKYDKGNYLWFAEASVGANNSAMLLPSSAYLAIKAASDGVEFLFKDCEGDYGTASSKESVKLLCADGNQKQVIEAMGRIMGTQPRGGNAQMIIVADFNVENGQVALGAHSELRGLVTGVTIA